MKVNRKQIEERSEAQGRKALHSKILLYKSATKDSRRDKTAVLYSTTFRLINVFSFSSV